MIKQRDSYPNNNSKVNYVPKHNGEVNYEINFKKNMKSRV